MSEDKGWEITAISQKTESSETNTLPDATSPVILTVSTQYFCSIFFILEISLSLILWELKKYILYLEWEKFGKKIISIAISFTHLICRLFWSVPRGSNGKHVLMSMAAHTTALLYRPKEVQWKIKYIPLKVSFWKNRTVSVIYQKTESPFPLTDLTDQILPFVWNITFVYSLTLSNVVPFQLQCFIPPQCHFLSFMFKSYFNTPDLVLRS